MWIQLKNSVSNISYYYSLRSSKIIPRIPSQEKKSIVKLYTKRKKNKQNRSTFETESTYNNATTNIYNKQIFTVFAGIV